MTLSASSDFTHVAYRKLLRAGLHAGYRFESVAEAIKLRDTQSYVCLLRHDCDNDLVAAGRLAEIEAEEGVRSTWFVMLRSAMYNVLAPMNAEIVRRIASAGHWIGLHFDEVPFADEPPDRVGARVEHERRFLSEELGIDVDVVSFHQPSARVIAGAIPVRALNTYDRTLLAGFYYTSDSNMVFRSGHPIDLFEARSHRLLHVLTHPEWWTHQPGSVDEKWNTMLRNNFDLAQGSLIAREKTYTRRRGMTLAVESET